MVVSTLSKFARSTKHFVLAIYYFIKGILEYFVPACLYAKDVSKDVVLITGAGSGLGRSIALEYAKLGSSLILWDISKTGIEQTKQMVEKVRNSDKNEAQKNKFCLIYVVDISDRDKVRAYGELVARDLENLRQYQQDELYVSVLVNNAGVYHGRLLEELTEEQIERMFKINILSHFWTVRAFLPAMKRHSKGHIVEVASMAGWAGLYKQVDYCSAKFANVGFEEALNMELDYLGYGDQIRTTCLCPSFINTPLFSGNQTKCAGFMSPEYVARQVVKGMRCNQSHVILPRFLANLTVMIKGFMPRKAFTNFVYSQTREWGSIDEIQKLAANRPL